METRESLYADMYKELKEHLPMAVGHFSETNTLVHHLVDNYAALVRMVETNWGNEPSVASLMKTIHEYDWLQDDIKNRMNQTMSLLGVIQKFLDLARVNAKQTVKND